MIITYIPQMGPKKTDTFDDYINRRMSLPNRVENHHNSPTANGGIPRNRSSKQRS